MAVNSSKKEAGFTLVEVLCVLALLGLTAGLVVLNLPKPPPPLRSEANGIAGLLNLAARQSVIDGKTRGVDFTKDSFEIFRYDGEWISEKNLGIENFLRIAVSVESQTIDLIALTKKKETTDTDITPLVYFDATGNVTGFKLSLEGPEEIFTLTADQRGRIVMETTQ